MYHKFKQELGLHCDLKFAHSAENARPYSRAFRHERSDLHL